MAIQSKKDNSRSTLASASKFGVALSGLFVAQEIQAEVLPLTFDAFFATQFVEGQETVVLDYQVFMYSVPLADLSLYPDFGLDNSGQIFANNHLLNYQTKDGYDSVFVEERSLRSVLTAVASHLSSLEQNWLRQTSFLKTTASTLKDWVLANTTLDSEILLLLWSSLGSSLK